MLFNDGSQDDPKLKIYLNLYTLEDLPADGLWPGFSGEQMLGQLVRDGYQGVQLIDNGLPPGTQLPFCGLDRINAATEAEAVVCRHKERGDELLTVHVGWGIEHESQAHSMVEAVLEASSKHALPVFLETHRATITQDLWRTVQLAKAFPELHYNCDFSHYYCGQEMVYGSFEDKLAFMEPIFSRTGFIHGRIASPGCMQVPIEEDTAARPAQAHGEPDFLADFRTMWIRAMTGFLGAAGPGDVLIFAPELLKPRYYYGRMFPGPTGELVEECDRYAQSLLLAKVAKECFEVARAKIGLA